MAVLRYLYPEQLDDFVTSVNNINEMQVALGRWVDENEPQEAVVATNDIGAIAFFGNRPIVDTIGLIDPEVIRRRRLDNPTKAMIDYFKQRGVTHALLFTNWHPDILLDPHLKYVHRVVLEDNVVCGGDTMLVSVLDWDLNDESIEKPPWFDEERENCEYYLRYKKILGF